MEDVSLQTDRAAGCANGAQFGGVEAGAIGENLDAGVAMRLGVGDNAEDTNKILRIQRQGIRVGKAVIQGRFEERVEDDDQKNGDPEAGR